LSYQFRMQNVRQRKVFDVTYHLEDKNAGRKTVVSDDLAALMGMTARFGFLINFTGIGSLLRSTLNDEMADTMMSTDEYGIPKNMLSFGLAELYLPEKELLRFAPFYLVYRVADRIIGASLPEDTRGTIFIDFLNRLGIDEQLFSLMESMIQRITDEGTTRSLTDHIRTRFRALLELQLQERLSTMPIVVDNLENELPDIFESNIEQVLREKREQLASAVSRLSEENGLTPLVEVVSAFKNFLNERQSQLRDKIEEITIARNQLLEQKVEFEGQIAQFQSLAFGPIRKRTFWDILAHFDPRLEREYIQYKVAGLAKDLHRLEQDNLILQMEIMQRQKAIDILNQLSKDVDTLIDQSQKSIMRLNELKSQMQPEINRLLSLDFKFHVPVGFSLIREEPNRQDDIDHFVEQMVIDESSDQTVNTVVVKLRERVGEYWELIQTESLDEQLLELIKERLNNELHIWEEIKKQLSEKQIEDRIDYCIGASAEYILTDSAVNHDNRSWIKIIGAPQETHESLQQILNASGKSDWMFATTNDQTRISFMQVRVGIPLHSIKSSKTNMEAYLKQSEQHDEERLHTRPEWRFLPDFAPIENRNDPRINVYVLQGIVAERLIYQPETKTYWYVPVSGSKESMGTNHAEVTKYLVTHQPNFVEIVSSFYTIFHLKGSVEPLRQMVNEAAHSLGPFSTWINNNAIDTVMAQIEYVRKNYDIGGGL
jgi:hypothetical protein